VDPLKLKHIFDTRRVEVHLANEWPFELITLILRELWQRRGETGGSDQHKSRCRHSERAYESTLSPTTDGALVDDTKPPSGRSTAKRACLTTCFLRVQLIHVGGAETWSLVIKMSTRTA
jgi:hypothetical protein